MSTKEIRRQVAANMNYQFPRDQRPGDSVRYRVDLNANGSIESWAKLQSSGDAGFDDAVLQAMRTTLPTLYHGDAPTMLMLAIDAQSLKEPISK